MGERDEILAEEGMNVCPAIHTPIYRIAIERERVPAFIIEDGIGVALRRMKGLIEQREGGQHREGAHGIMNKQDGGRMRLRSPSF